MKVCLLSNPAAGSAGQLGALRDALARRHRLTVLETTSREDLEEKVGAAAFSGRFDAVAVAGGDGTLHAAVAALGPRFPRTPLAFLPLGTGNDLCRTLGIPLDPLDAARLIRRGRHRAIDVVRIDGLGVPFLVNAAAGGFSGEVAGEVTAELKQAWGPLAYLRGAAGPANDPTTYCVTFRFDGGEPETHDVLNLVIANGRSAGGGLNVAPTANPEDGLLDVVVVEPGDALDLAAVAARLLAGDYLADEKVFHRRAKSVRIECDPPMPLSLDGELTEAADATFTVIPRAIRVYPGRDYRPNPAGKAVGAGGLGRQLFGGAADAFDGLRRVGRWPRSGFLSAGLLVLLFALIAVTVWLGHWAEWNIWAAATAGEWRSPVRSEIALKLTRLGDPGVVWYLVAVGALGLVGLGRWREAAALAVGAAGVGASELLIKPWLAVPRPENWLMPDLARGFSFPSGHALRMGFLATFATAVALGAGRRFIAGLLLALGLAVALSRVYLGVHSPADVTAGLTLGAAWALAARAAAWYPGGGTEENDGKRDARLGRSD